ncbi:MAG: pyridoxamine 5'-phosphate oxidase family protein, partial [Reyranella sp.]|nr:pyridoxamine 5'-phosphate oxidase family protein [Reyranella sp.]
SAKIRDKHVADEEEDYAGVPAWSALYPITQVLGEPSECERQIPGLTRPDGMSDFEPGTRFDELMTKSYRRTFGG